MKRHIYSARKGLFCGQRKEGQATIMVGGYRQLTHNHSTTTVAMRICKGCIRTYATLNRWNRIRNVT